MCIFCTLQIRISQPKYYLIKGYVVNQQMQNTHWQT